MNQERHTPSRKARERDLGFQDALFEMERPHEFVQLNDPELRYKYVGHTDSLIARAIANETDTMVFLDKSARPVAWLMKALWPILAQRDDGSVAPMPDIKFANIDREQWGALLGRSEDKEGGIINVDNMPASALNGLRRTFANIDGGEETMLTDKRITVVDEVYVSGDTLTMATKMFEKAFPDAQNIDGAYWMLPQTKRTKGGVRYNADLPIWYDSHKVTGRLVANRAENVSRGSVSARQRDGALFLSTRFPEVDEDGVQLREEMHELAKEVKQGKMPVKLDYKFRDMDEADHLMEKINGVSVEEFAAVRQQAEKEGKPFPALFVSYKRAKAANQAQDRQSS